MGAHDDAHDARVSPDSVRGPRCRASSCCGRSGRPPASSTRSRQPGSVRSTTGYPRSPRCCTALLVLMQRLVSCLDICMKGSPADGRLLMRQVFAEVPQGVGFDIEVKMATPKSCSRTPQVPTLQRNGRPFCATVLSVWVRIAGSGVTGHSRTDRWLHAAGGSRQDGGCHPRRDSSCRAQRAAHDVQQLRPGCVRGAAAAAAAHPGMHTWLSYQ